VQEAADGVVQIFHGWRTPAAVHKSRSRPRLGLAVRCLDPFYEHACVGAQRIVFDSDRKGCGQAVEAVCMKRQRPSWRGRVSVASSPLSPQYEAGRRTRQRA
jgi:hypothetical protein